jgi:hypothetical protein
VSQADETPLSNLISDLTQAPTRSLRRRFVDEFHRSAVGVIAKGAAADAFGEIVTSAETPISLGVTNHGGNTRILAFADPKVFAARFGRQFSAETSGASVMETVLANPSCRGILVNSATAKVSAVIDRATIKAFVRGSAPKPWWKLW